MLLEIPTKQEQYLQSSYAWELDTEVIAKKTFLLPQSSPSNWSKAQTEALVDISLTPCHKHLIINDY